VSAGFRDRILGYGMGLVGGSVGVVADVLKAAGGDGTRWMAELCCGGW
jgi:hypothetical protein